jgi:hypothetical protein
MSLRTLARGQPCYLRLIGCTGNPEQTVLAHIRRGNIAGMGQKPCDLAATPCCDFCHGCYDGRYKAHGYTRTELDAEMLRALCQWLDFLNRNEILAVIL